MPTSELIKITIAHALYTGKQKLGNLEKWCGGGGGIAQQIFTHTFPP